MDFQTKVSEIGKVRTDCAVVGLFSDGELTPSAQIIDKSNNGIVQELIKQGDLNGKAGETLWLHHTQGTAATRILLVGLGDKNAQTRQQIETSAKAAITALKKAKLKQAAIFLLEGGSDDISLEKHSHIIAETLLLNTYQYSVTKSTKPTPISLKKITAVLTDRKQQSEVKAGFKTGHAIALGANVAKELGNLPGNICTPTYLANEAKRIARKHPKFSAKILEEKHMRELGMGSLLSVSAGSDQPAKLIILEYKGAAKSKKPYVLVGKGITFDTGGISLKPGAGMDEMKYDMCGAASVIGTMQALQELELPINVVAIIAASENMPNGNATKPGDIVTAMSGKTIEILNTDAEGRLVLCDALTYAEKFKPAAVIDIATLTGACVIALGKHASGLYSNSDTFAQELLNAGLEAGDRAWHMPLWDEYKKQLSSNFADLANIGGRDAGSVTAACFLSHFTESYTWAHLDIAGTAWMSGAAKGATGRPVPLLMQYLINKAKSNQMTRIDFYAIADTTDEARMRFACRLMEKAFHLGNKVLVLTENDDQAETIDNLLWTFKPESFIPHNRSTKISDKKLLGNEVIITTGNDYPDYHDVLINLTQTTPSFFSRFNRLAEIVIQTPEFLEKSRKSYKFYQHRGYPIQFHDLR